MKIKAYYLWVKKEILGVLPAFIFFIFSFSFLDIVESDLLKRAGISPFSFLEIIISAALVAKVLLVIDHMPFINLFPRIPLIYNIVWKTLVYWSFTLLARVVIRLYPYLSSAQSLTDDLHTFANKVDWSLFLTIQGFYLILFALFVSAKELTTKIGATELKKILFGIRGSKKK